MANLSDYSWLVGDEAAAWVDRIAHDERTELQQLEALRRDLPVGRARLVVEQVVLRRRAVAKFGDLAERMFFTRIHLEQATDIWVARYKASRWGSTAQEGVMDYCCGIGGDLVALSEKCRTTGWDNSEIARLLATANAPRAVAVCQGDVNGLVPPPDYGWHLDPDRRATGRRRSAVAASSPGPELVDRWFNVNARGAVKLAPAADTPASWADGEREWITRDGECRQQVAWLGPLATCPGRRRATIVAQHGPVEMFDGEPHVELHSTDQPGEYLYDPDPSILAADLLGSLAAEQGLHALGAGGAYLTSDDYRDSSFTAAFRVRDCLPLRPALIAKYCAEHGIGRLEIKKRGVATEPESLRRHLRLRGDDEITLVLTRTGKRKVAIVAERVAR